MINTAPLFALQTYYMIRKHRKLDQCERCKYYKGFDRKCKDGMIPEFDWKYCPDNYF